MVDSLLLGRTAIYGPPAVREKTKDKALKSGETLDGYQLLK